MSDAVTKPDAPVALTTLIVAPPPAPIPPPVVVPAGTPAKPGVLGVFFTAMHKGASLVYHDLIAIEGDVTAWRTDNPVAAIFISHAVAYGTSFLSSFGISVPSVELAAAAVLATLRDMASTDSSVPTKMAAPPPATVPDAYSMPLPAAA